MQCWVQPEESIIFSIQKSPVLLQWSNEQTNNCKIDQKLLCWAKKYWDDVDTIDLIKPCSPCIKSPSFKVPLWTASNFDPPLSITSLCPTSVGRDLGGVPIASLGEKTCKLQGANFFLVQCSIIVRYGSYSKLLQRINYSIHPTHTLQHKLLTFEVYSFQRPRWSLREIEINFIYQSKF